MKKSSNSTAIDSAYRAIREAIFQRKYKPGFHLKEEEFSEAFKISRTPVREAIRMLAAEGLVDIKENRRSYVADVDDEDMEDVFEIVAMLESFSAGLAAKRITPEQIDELKQIQSQLESGDLDDDMHFLDANTDFHHALHEASGSRLLNKLIQQVVNYPSLCYLKAGVHTENETAARQHREIIAALETGDAAYAALAMRMHTETVRIQYRDIISASKSEIASAKE